MFRSIPSPPLLLLTSLLAFFQLSSAVRMIESNSLNPCQDNSGFTASLFNVIFFPDNGSVHFDVIGVSSIAGNITAEVEVIAYGYSVIKKRVNPCDDIKNFGGFCPMSSGQINIPGTAQLDKSSLKSIPGIAYTIPDLDGLIRVQVNDTSTNQPVACLEVPLSNGKTVDQPGVGWSTAVIAGLGLLASAVTSGLGHTNTAAHIAANALSLFGYFQAQAIFGMTAVSMPPIVQSWTQNFDWSMGIINVRFLQNIFTWYQLATGGKPDTLLNDLSTTSVQVEKRSDQYLASEFMRSYNEILRRSNQDNTINEVTKSVVVKGIKRMAFRAGIESTNVFMTGSTFFIIFVALVVIGVAAFKGACELSVKAGWLKSDKFKDFRNGWLVVLKGILFRMTLIGYPQMCVLCLWELTQHDSPAEVVLALFFFFSMTATLGWAALKVIRIAKRSVTMHKNPAYILYSDPASLNKWGFLYVQFRATAYYFIVPVLGYVLIKAIFIAFVQSNGLVQAIALVLIEGGVLVGVSILRPWMDKKTNSFNISIAAINFVNTIFLMFFTEVFNQPGLVTGVMGVVYFFANAIFALVLLILVLVSSFYAIFSKNPDTRYQPMRDDRGSFIKSQTQLNTELDALGATARGDMAMAYKQRDLDDDESLSSGSMGRHPHDSRQALPLSANEKNGGFRDGPHSPVSPSVPLFPSDASNRHGPPSNYSGGARNLYPGQNDSRPNSDATLMGSRSNTASPMPGSNPGYGRGGSSHSNVAGFRNQNNNSPWQRGAGYDH